MPPPTVGEETLLRWKTGLTILFAGFVRSKKATTAANKILE